MTDALAVSLAGLMLAVLVQIGLMVRGFARVEAKVDFQGENQQRHETTLKEHDVRLRAVEQCPSPSRR